MENHVPFKVFTYWTEDAKPEIRRFGVDRSLVTSFVYLNAKIQETFPGLKIKNYSITWTDEEGDDVTISSDDEILTALVATQSSSVKLNVVCKEDNKEKEDICEDIVFATITDGGAHHFGVTCDNCEREVVGFRYKCTTCNDYDLCSKCESAGAHPMHCMVRVPAPTMPRAMIKAAIKKSRHFLKTVAGNTVEGECPYKKSRREKSGETKHGHEHHERHHRRSRTNWLETFTSYMNEFANLAGDIDLDVEKKNPKKNEQSQGQQENQSQQGQEATQSEQQKTAENTENPKPSTSIPVCPFGPAINMEGIQKLIELYGPAMNMEGIQKLFELYRSGLLLDVLAQPSTSASNDASVNTNNVETTNASVNTTDVEMGQGDRSKRNSEEKPGSSRSSTSSEAKDETKADGWTVIGDLLDPYTKQPSAPEDLPTPIGFNLPQEFQERVKITEGQNLYPPLNAATAVMNPKEPERVIPAVTPVPPVTPVPQTTPVPQATPVPQVKPIPVVNQSVRYHANPKIDAATKHMLAMGFTNEGGWLTQLLASKDGNIPAVLDLLSPVKPKQ